MSNCASDEEKVEWDNRRTKNPPLLLHQLLESSRLMLSGSQSWRKNESEKERKAVPADAARQRCVPGCGRQVEHARFSTRRGHYEKGRNNSEGQIERKGRKVAHMVRSG